MRRYNAGGGGGGGFDFSWLLGGVALLVVVAIEVGIVIGIALLTTSPNTERLEIIADFFGAEDCEDPNIYHESYVPGTCNQFNTSGDGQNCTMFVACITGSTDPAAPAACRFAPGDNFTYSFMIDARNGTHIASRIFFDPACTDPPEIDVAAPLDMCIPVDNETNCVTSAHAMQFMGYI